MRRVMLSVVGAAIVGFLVVQSHAVQAQADRPDLRVMVVGLAAKDYQESLDFYTRVMGFKVGFEFKPNGAPPDTTRRNAYLQLSRDSFMELSATGADATPRFTHIHLGTGDRDAVVAQLQKAGVEVGNIRLASPTMERSATIMAPEGIRFEATQAVAGSMVQDAFDAWTETGPRPRVLVAGVAVEDYPVSQRFYGMLMGFPVAFSFTVNGQSITTYYQVSKETFLEVQAATAERPAGITHVHIQVPDVAAAVARLRSLGLQAPKPGEATPMTVTDPGVTKPSNTKSANVYDPQGLRLELNELIPQSLTQIAMDAWQ